MKKIWSLMMLLCFISVPAMAAEMTIEDEPKELGFWFEARMDSKKSSELVGWYQRQFTDIFGIYGLVNLESDDRYRQGYVGITVNPFPKALSWLQVGAGLGRERDSESSGVRRNLFVSVDAEKVSGFATYEDGMTGPWHRVNVVYHLNDKVSIGAMQETNLGLAPRVEYHIKKNLTVWGAMFRDRVVLAVNFSF